MDYIIRIATKEDAKDIYNLVQNNIAHHNLSHISSGSEEELMLTVFNPKANTKVLVLEIDGEVVGFTLYFFSYTSMYCSYGIFVEDIYIKEEYRGKGFGLAFFKELCRTAKEHNCSKIEWAVLNSNNIGIEFYSKIGSKKEEDWRLYCLEKEEIEKLASVGKPVKHERVNV